MWPVLYLSRTFNLVASQNVKVPMTTRFYTVHLLRAQLQEDMSQQCTQVPVTAYLKNVNFCPKQQRSRKAIKNKEEHRYND